MLQEEKFLGLYFKVNIPMIKHFVVSYAWIELLVSEVIKSHHLMMTIFVVLRHVSFLPCY